MAGYIIVKSTPLLANDQRTIARYVHEVVAWARSEEWALQIASEFQSAESCDTPNILVSVFAFANDTFSAFDIDVLDSTDGKRSNIFVNGVQGAIELDLDYLLYE